MRGPAVQFSSKSFGFIVVIRLPAEGMLIPLTIERPQGAGF